MDHLETLTEAQSSLLAGDYSWPSALAKSAGAPRTLAGRSGVGVDFVAILKHQLTASTVRGLPTALAPDAAPNLARATAALKHTGEPACPLAGGAPLWCIDEVEMLGADPGEVWTSGGAVELVGPQNLHLSLFHQGCGLSDGTRWQAFLDDRPRQLALRRCCYELAHILGSPSAIYVPDDASVVLWEGVPYEQIAAWLRERYGPPAATLARVTTARSSTSPSKKPQGIGRYFTDTFADLALNARHES